MWYLRVWRDGAIGVRTQLSSQIHGLEKRESVVSNRGEIERKEGTHVMAGSHFVLGPIDLGEVITFVTKMIANSISKGDLV